MTKKFILAGIFLGLLSMHIMPIERSIAQEAGYPAYYKPYLDLLAQVYEKMDKHYYKPVNPKLYQAYVKKYCDSVLSKIKNQTGRIDMVAYRGAGMLVYALRNPEDKFTNFLPPKKAKEYSEKIYGYAQGIGITGNISADGYVISYVQLHSDSFEKGVRSGDLITRINDIDVKTLDEAKIHDLLYPPLNTSVNIALIEGATKAAKTFDILCKEYFNETVVNIPTGVKGVHCLRISQFNKLTGPDFKETIKEITKSPIKLLIIDLADNPGGPPLAVQELMGIFLPPQRKLFYYKRKNLPEIGLSSPVSDVHYDGPMAVVVSKKSGSGAELMAATLKSYNRALVIGKEHTAGMAFLKSTYNFDDGSMLAMLTGNSFIFDGTEMDFKGLDPVVFIPSEAEDPIRYVVDKFSKNELFTDGKSYDAREAAKIR